MAAFLNKCPARIAVKAVPIANLFEERKAMLAQRQHLDPPCGPFGGLKEGGDWWHITIFHRDPNRRGIAVTDLAQAVLLRGIRKERLFHEDGQGAMFGEIC